MTPRSDRGPENDAWASSRKRGARRSYESTSSWKQSMTEKAVPPAIATMRVGAAASASGTSSPTTIQTITPAANPSPTGRIDENASTKRNAGTARSGWQAQKILQPAAERTDVPRGTRTRLIASPSGMLWIAIATVIRRPSVDPPPNAAPTPTPSAAE